MDIVLRKIKQSCFDDVVDKAIESYYENKKVIVSSDYLNENSEKVFINNKEAIIEIDINKYKEIVETDDYKYNKMSKVGILLHKDFKTKEGISIPKYILYQKEMWAYLSLTIFSEIVPELRAINGNGSSVEEKIKKAYFNCGNPSRTCLLFIWSIVDRLNSENSEKTTQIAFEFIDPVRAIYERSFSRSPNLLRAFVQGIINNNKDYRFKNDPYRTMIPNNISCYAAVNMLEIMEYNKVVDIISEQQREMLNL